MFCRLVPGVLSVTLEQTPDGISAPGGLPREECCQPAPRCERKECERSQGQYEKADCKAISNEAPRQARKYHHEYDLLDAAPDRHELEADRTGQGHGFAGACRTGGQRMAGAPAAGPRGSAIRSPQRCGTAGCRTGPVCGNEVSRPIRRRRSTRASLVLQAPAPCSGAAGNAVSIAPLCGTVAFRVLPLPSSHQAHYVRHPA